MGGNHEKALVIDLLLKSNQARLEQGATDIEKKKQQLSTVLNGNGELRVKADDLLGMEKEFHAYRENMSALREKMKVNEARLSANEAKLAAEEVKLRANVVDLGVHEAKLNANIRELTELKDSYKKERETIAKEVARKEEQLNKRYRNSELQLATVSKILKSFVRYAMDRGINEDLQLKLAATAVVALGNNDTPIDVLYNLSHEIDSKYMIYDTCVKAINVHQDGKFEHALAMLSEILESRQ